MLAVTLGLLFHARYPLGQALQPCGHFLLALVTLLLVMVHGAEQAFQVTFQHLLEVVQIGRLLHAVLQAIDLFADLRVHLPRRRTAVGMALAGGLQVALEGFRRSLSRLR